MKYLMLALGFFLCAFFFNSCDLESDEDSAQSSLDNVWGALATVQPINENSHSFSLVLDDGTTMWPAANYASWYTPKANQRAIVYFTMLSDHFQGYDHAIMVRNISDILTKYPVGNSGSEENDEKYGTDPAEILDMWIGDGYLNVWFGFNYGGGEIKHFINLVQRGDANTPYYFEFRHNAYDDTVNMRQKGLVAFNLSSLNIKEEVTLTIKVNTFEGEKEFSIKYDPAAKETNVNKGFTENDIAELE